MIGERIKAARVAKGLSLRALAELVGVSHQAIFKYETGKDVPASEVLLALSEALGVKPEFFFRPARVMEIVPAFRKRSCLSAKAERIVLAKVKEALERRLELEELTMTQVQNDLWSIVEQVSHVGSSEELEGVAQQVRNLWGLGIAPIDNLTALLEDRGVRIEVVDGVDERFDACGFWVTTKGQGDVILEHLGARRSAIPVMAVRADVPGDRQRFSLAHELGHLILDGFFGCKASVTGSESAGSLRVEAAAHRFAGAFIVPREAVIQELGPKRKNVSIGELYLLKHKYGLSIQAWIRRAREVGAISKETELRLFRQLSAKGYRKVEPGKPVPFEKPIKARQLALRAVAEGIISRSKAAELLGVPLTELQEEGEV